MEVAATATTTDLKMALVPVSDTAGGIVGTTLNEINAATKPVEVARALEKGGEDAADAAGAAMKELVGAKWDKRQERVAGGLGLAGFFFAIAAGFAYIGYKAATKDDDKEKIEVVPDDEDQ
jgi:hypothetical protein